MSLLKREYLPGVVIQSVILAAWEAAIGRIMVQGQPGQKVREIHLDL
jgi:hypothetical protein